MRSKKSDYCVEKLPLRALLLLSILLILMLLLILREKLQFITSNCAALLQEASSCDLRAKKIRRKSKTQTHSTVGERSMNQMQRANVLYAHHNNER